MATSAPRRAVPGRIRFYVAAVAALALLLLPLSRLAPGSSSGPVAIFAALTLAAMIAGAHWYPVHIGPKRKLNVGTAPEVAAVLLLPGPFAALTLAAGTLTGEAHLRAPPVQRLFNAAAAVLRAILGTAVYTAVLQLRPDMIAEPAAALTAATVMYASTTVLVRGAVAVQLRENPLRRSALPPPDMLVAEAALSLTGVLAALAARDHVWALPLLVAPAIIAQRAVRYGVALQEQTRLAEEALAAAKAALAVRDEFLSLASHELRTPLTALKSYIELARRRLERGTATQEAVQLMAWADTQTERLEGLVHALLDVSRIAEGRFVIEREPVALGPLVQRVVDLERAAEPGRVIDLSLPETRPVIMADPGRLEQVLVNLLENARKYSPREKPIRVCVSPGEDTVAVAVRDEGVGIPLDEQQRIFDRFHRAGNRDAGVAGLGLGLYIAHELARAHGGRLTVESAPGAGSTFTVILPQSDVVADEIRRERLPA